MPLLFFFNDTATTEIYTLSLHDALPIVQAQEGKAKQDSEAPTPRSKDRKKLFGTMEALRLAREIGRGTRLNSSHGYISYAVFCLKKKKKKKKHKLLNKIHSTKHIHTKR